jgi:hypothetical protein
MREVSPGDAVFSFVDTFIGAIGVAQSYCWESPKPTESGTTGQYWDKIGWKVLVRFTPFLHRVRPKDHLGVLGPLLPPKYSPLQANGNGIQSIYLAEVSETFAEVLAGIIGAEAQRLIAAIPVGALMQTNDDPDFEDNGRLILPPVALRPSLERMGVETEEGGERRGVYRRPEGVSGIPPIFGIAESGALDTRALSRSIRDPEQDECVGMACQGRSFGGQRSEKGTGHSGKAVADHFPSGRRYGQRPLQVRFCRDMAWDPGC